MANLFSVLFYVSLAMAAVALLRGRPGLFFISANEAIVLRAFLGIVEFGQPRSQAFLPIALFSQSNIETAAGIFLIAVPLTALFVLLPDAAGAPSTAEDFPALPRWSLWVLGGYFLVFSASMSSIFTTAYYSEGHIVFDAPGGGLQALALGLVLYELHRRVRAGLLTSPRATLILMAVLFVTDYSKGQTGLATSFLLTGTFLFYSARRGVRKRLLPVLGFLSAIVLSVMVLRGVRNSFHEQGTQAVAGVAEELRSAEAQRERTAEGLEDRMNGPQMAAHALECVWLYDNGHAREWRSIYYPFIYTFQPSFLLKPLGLTRPKEAAWELADYFIHGGGLLIFAEMYWNGGYFCVFVVTLGLVAAAWFADTRRNRSPVVLLLACIFTPMLLQGTQYGIAYSMRGIFNTAIAILLLAPLQVARLRRARAAPLSLAERTAGPH